MRAPSTFIRVLIRASLSMVSATSLALTVATSAAPAAAAASAASGAPHRISGLGPTAPTIPSVADLEAMFAEVPQDPRLSPARNMSIAEVDQRIADLEKQFSDAADTATALEDRAAAFSGEADGYNKESAAADDQVKQHNAKVDALKARIDAHNAEPHTFEIPDQQAAANAYQAEADELNGEKSALNAEDASLQSEQTKLDGELNKLTTEKDQLQKDADTLGATLNTLQNAEQQLENDRLNLLQGILTDLENLAAEQNAPSLVQEAPGASDLAAGGDAPAPGDESEPTGQPKVFQQADPLTPAQPDPLMADSAGGDLPSRSEQNQALDNYAKQRGVTVIEQPVTVRLSPQTARSVPAEKAGQLSLTNTYQGVVREPSGKYRAIEVVSPGSGYNPGQRAFNDAIAGGGTAEAVIDGRPAVIDGVDTVVDPGPAPAPAPAPGTTPTPGSSPAASPSPQSTPTPSPSEDDKHPDCRDQKPAGAQDLPNKGWVVYFPLGPHSRGTGMEACLFGYGPDTQTAPNVDIAGWDAAVRRAGQLMQLDPDAKNPVSKCHFLAARFGGSNTDPRNFSACWQNPVNVGAAGMSGAEGAVALDLKDGNVVFFTETAVYTSGESDTPSSYNILAWAQKPGTAQLIPVWSEPVPNEKLIDGQMENLGN